ncbi:MAG: hypothetical protein JNM80_14795 [Phycisphaerae bacterium]|nr:hypothetical protein [Phycisphaerae bacterium]
MRTVHLLACGVGLALSASAMGAPVDIGFARVTPANAPQNPAAQFKAVLSEVSSSVVRFRFTNTAVIYCSISEIYYDNRNSAPLSSLMTPLNQFGATFTGGGANPGNLPGGQNLSPAFSATAVFSADAQGNPANGLDTAADWLEMDFVLGAGKTFNSVVDAIANGDLRIGLHVRAIGTSGDSDSFVNGNPPNVIPLPPAALAGLAGLAGVAVLRRRRV